MSTTSTAPAAPASPCCTSCTTPHTSQDFLRNHIRTHVETPTDDICRICWLPFNTTDSRICVPDVACQVVNLPGCTHTFGWCCILKTMADGGTRCPLCRTPWYTPYVYVKPPMRLRHPVATSALHKQLFIDDWAWRYGTDAVSARCHLFREWLLLDNIPWLTHANMLETGMRFDRVVRALQTHNMTRFLEHLADTQPSAVDFRLHDPYAMRQELYFGNDPFTFCNWQASTRDIEVVAFRALWSANGMRLQERLTRHLMTARRRLAKGVCTVEHVLIMAEEAWVWWYGEESVRVFSRFLLRLAYYCQSA